MLDGIVEHLDAVTGGGGNFLLMRGTTPQRMGNLFTRVFFRDFVPKLGVGIKENKSVGILFCSDQNGNASMDCVRTIEVDRETLQCYLGCSCREKHNLWIPATLECYRAAIRMTTAQQNATNDYKATLRTVLRPATCRRARR